MTKNSLKLIFAAALFATTLGCPPPAPEPKMDVDTGTATSMPDDNMTTTNMTTTAETP